MSTEGLPSQHGPAWDSHQSKDFQHINQNIYLKIILQSTVIAVTTAHTRIWHRSLLDLPSLACLNQKRIVSDTGLADSTQVRGTKQCLMVLQQQYNTKLILEIWCQQICAVLLRHPQQLLDQCKQIPSPALPSAHTDLEPPGFILHLQTEGATAFCEGKHRFSLRCSLF